MTRATLRSGGADDGVVGSTWIPRVSCCPRLLLCVLPGTESPSRKHTVIKMLPQAVARDIRLLLDMTTPGAPQPCQTPHQEHGSLVPASPQRLTLRPRGES